MISMARMNTCWRSTGTSVFGASRTVLTFPPPQDGDVRDDETQVGRSGPRPPPLGGGMGGRGALSFRALARNPSQHQTGCAEQHTEPDCPSETKPGERKLLSRR